MRFRRLTNSYRHRYPHSRLRNPISKTNYRISNKSLCRSLFFNRRRQTLKDLRANCLIHQLLNPNKTHLENFNLLLRVTFIKVQIQSINSLISKNFSNIAESCSIRWQCTCNLLLPQAMTTWASSNPRTICGPCRLQPLTSKS